MCKSTCLRDWSSLFQSGRVDRKQKRPACVYTPLETTNISVQKNLEGSCSIPRRTQGTKRRGPELRRASRPSGGQLFRWLLVASINQITGDIPEASDTVQVRLSDLCEYQVAKPPPHPPAPAPPSSRAAIGRDALPVARTLSQPLTPPTLFVPPFPATLLG